MGKQCGYLMLPRPAMLHDDDAEDDDESSFFSFWSQSGEERNDKDDHGSRWVFVLFSLSFH